MSVTPYLKTFLSIAGGFIAGVGLVAVLITSNSLDPLREENRRLREQLQQVKEQAAGPSRIGPDLHRTYEWQWAGENWYGRVTLAKVGEANVVTAARVGVLQKSYSDGQSIFKIGPAVVELQRGSFEVLGNGDVKIDLQVVKSVNYQTGRARQRIAGPLRPTLCLAGKVHYETSRESDVGDMILVGYQSTTSDTVDKWFR